MMMWSSQLTIVSTTCLAIHTIVLTMSGQVIYPSKKKELYDIFAKRKGKKVKSYFDGME
jgi:hypothetical protein